MAATDIMGRSFSDALYERYCDFDTTFDDLKNDCDIVFFVGSSPKKTGRKECKVKDELESTLSFFSLRRIWSCSQCIDCCLNR